MIQCDRHITCGHRDVTSIYYFKRRHLKIIAYKSLTISIYSIMFLLEREAIYSIMLSIYSITSSYSKKEQYKIYIAKYCMVFNLRERQCRANLPCIPYICLSLFMIIEPEFYICTKRHVPYSVTI